MNRVLLTGGRGFLGQHLRACLEVRRYEVDACGSKDVNLHKATDFAARCNLVDPHLVIHLAAFCGGIGLNQCMPGDMARWNLDMASRVFESMERDVRPGTKLILIGSVCSYPKYCRIPFEEDAIWSGYPEETNAPYGIAKRAMMVMAQAYRQQYGLNAITLIPTNMYGPGDHFEESRSHVIPAMIRKFVEARDAGLGSVTLWGTGNATRDFLHVRDAARAIVDAAERYDSPEPMNLGTGQEISIRDLAVYIKEIVGFKGEILFDHSKPDGQPRRCLDISRARAAIGFEPTISLLDGLVETVAWYEATRTQRREPESCGK